MRGLLEEERRSPFWTVFFFGSLQKAWLPEKVRRVKYNEMKTPRGCSGLFFQLDPLLTFPSHPEKPRGSPL